MLLARPRSFCGALLAGLVLFSTACTFANPAYADGGAVKQTDPVGNLSDEERRWLAEKHTVRVRVGEVPPYQIRNPRLSGLSVDLLDAVAERYSIKVVYVPELIDWPHAIEDVGGPRQRIDLLLTMNRTPERDQKFAFTQDYLSMPWVIYTRNDSPFVSSIASLAGKRVSVEKGFLIQELLQKDLPSIHFVEETNSEDALRALATGRADAYVGNLAIGAYLIRQFGLGNLVVAAPTPYGDHKLAMAIRKDWAVLASIIDKGIAAMPFEAQNKLMQKWTRVEALPQRDYTLAWQILGVSSLLLAVFLYWNRRLSREVARRRATEAELARHRDHLELLVGERTADLSVAKQKAEAANIAKSAFLANMSHEMRTPLNQLIGMAALIRHGPLTPKQTERMSILDTASHRLLNLIDTLLELTRIESQEMDRVDETFQLGDLVQDVADAVREQASEKKLQLTVDAPSERFALLGDRPHIQQALLNYASNAIRFTEAGSVTIRARVSEMTGQGDYPVMIRFEVADTGIGIHPQDQSRLFALFEQVDNSSTRKFDGLGVGLVMTKKIAQMMGGDAGCDSTPGKGSVFWFTVKTKKAPGPLPP